ncbi:MAG: ABC transporter transmembrane domain-containing protein [Actinomycetes bacterium]
MSGRGDLTRTVALFRRFAVGQRRAFGFAVLLLVAEASTAVFEPLLLGYLVDFLTGDRAELSFAQSFEGTIAMLALALIGLTAVNSLSDSLAEIALAKAGRTIGYNLRQALFKHLQKLSLAFHVRRRAGDVLTRITADVTALEDFVVSSLSDIIGSLLLIVGTIAFLLTQSIQVTLLALVIVPVLAVVSNAFSRRIKAAAKQLRAREGDLASTAQEMLMSIGVVQTYGRNDYEQQRFADRSRSAMHAVFRTARLEAAFSFTVSVLEAVIIAVVIWVGAVVIGAPTITAGTLVTLILLIQQMFKPTRRIIKEWNTIAKLYASVERVSDLLDRRPSVVDAPDAFTAPPLRGEIEFADVSFAYEAPPGEGSDEEVSRLALDSLSFAIPAGETVALVGHSGGGKSTIAQLIPRLYDPHVGSVRLDGYDIREFTLDSLRGQISMVLQETVLFSGSVAENIAYGREGATFDDVVLAAKRANAHDFVTALPQGYDTVLGERAATLSGGQRQRLAIARAFVRDAPILVLDEPTTGLDAESSDLVHAALHTLVGGKTALIISHDFNLIRDVDRVLVVSAGRVLEDGPPAELLARDGLYADLHHRQFGKPPSDARPSPVAVAVAAGFEDEETVAASGRHRAFETVLMQAVPLPASPAAFRQLSSQLPVMSPVEAAPQAGSGRLPPSPRSTRGDGAAEVDPLRGPALDRWLPGLRGALDRNEMAPRLQQMLGAGWVLDWCEPGKVLLEPGHGATLRYRLGIRDETSGRVVEHLVGGHILQTTSACDELLGGRLLPLADRAMGRADLGMFARTVDQVPALRLVLHAYPLDADLPGLLDATDAPRLGETLATAFVGSPEGLVLQECRPHLVQYARRGRCVLRYDVLWRLGSSGRSLKQVLFGKIYSDDQGAGVGPAADAVRAHVSSRSREGFQFLVPRFRGYLPDVGLVLLEALPGIPRIPALVKQRVAGSEVAEQSGLTVESALATCARITASLHASPVRVGVSRTLVGELEAVAAQLDGVEPFAPALAEQLRTRLLPVAEVAREPGGAPQCAHGDLTPAQVLFDGPLSGLVDLDTVCTAEPALDLGHFVAYLSLVVGKAARSSGRADGVGEHVDRLFWESYLRAADVADVAVLRDRVTAYRGLTLARVAVRSWLQLKPDRLRLALDLLDDEAQVRQAARR